VGDDPRAKRQKALGAAIRAQREETGLSQEEFAHQAKLHRNYVGRVERGELNLSFASLTTIANALGIELSALLREYERRLR
jgi:transcriptional regulator with XRE-family HTH domain